MPLDGTGCLLDGTGCVFALPMDVAEWYWMSRNGCLCRGMVLDVSFTTAKEDGTGWYRMCLSPFNGWYYVTSNEWYYVTYNSMEVDYIDPCTENVCGLKLFEY